MSSNKKFDSSPSYSPIESPDDFVNGFDLDEIKSSIEEIHPSIEAIETSFEDMQPSPVIELLNHAKKQYSSIKTLRCGINN